MSKNPRQKICNFLFVAKAILAVLLGVAALGLQCQKVASKYSKGTELKKNILEPVNIDPSRQECQADGAAARLEPPEGKVLMGFHLNWEEITPIQFRSKVDFTPAVINAFLRMDPTTNPVVDYPILQWHGEEVQRIGGILSLTIEPIALEQITDAHISELSDRILAINSKLGVPMMLRFGHEMNGDWTNYGYQPTLFKSTFRRVALSVKSKTNMTAIVWGPNLGINYPFTSPGALVQLPLEGTPDFAELDTDNNGVINNIDDPYLPYYPGDDIVDWVALSLYWYPDEGTGFNTVPPATYFKDMATSTGPSMSIVNIARQNDPLRNFYARFSVERNKPMMIPETAAPYVPSRPAVDSDADIKRSWYSQIFSEETRAALPRIKIVNQFEESKADAIGANAQLRDWRVTANPAVLSAFKGVLQEHQNIITYGDSFVISCGGKYTPKK